MIVYAACVGDPEKYRNICLPGLRRVAGPDDLLIEAQHDRSIFAAYNEVLDGVRDRDDLEALVLLHEDTEVLDPGFGDVLREHLADPDVAVVGTVGARGIEGLAWWNGEVSGCAAEPRGILQGDTVNREVDALDGMLLALSPWVAVFSGAAILLASLSFNLLGDGLQDRLDPCSAGAR